MSWIITFVMIRVVPADPAAALAGDNATPENDFAYEYLPKPFDVPEAVRLVRRALRAERYDALILDLMLPGRDGLSIIEELRRARNAIPILVVTARAEIDDKVSLLDRGADDYLVKPFDLRELDARLRAVLRRPAGRTTSLMEFGDTVVDLAGHSVSVSGQAVELSRREFRLLEILLARVGAVVPKERLMSQLFSFDEAVSVNALELYVSRLRRKLEGSGVGIRTLRGLGYQLVRVE